MATSREQIEHPRWIFEHPWKNFTKSSKWLKRQINKLMRRKPIEEDEVGIKTNRKPTRGWEY